MRRRRSVNLGTYARALVAMVIVAGILSPIQANLFGGSPAHATQSDLTASLSAAGEMLPPSSFTDLTTENLNSLSSIAAGTAVAIGTIGTLNSGTVTAQSGGTYSSPTNTTYTIGQTSAIYVDAAWYGGSGLSLIHISEPTRRS